MTVALPVQEFQIGQRVRLKGQTPFVIRAMFLGWDEVLRYGSNNGYDCFEANKLTLAPERLPYEPSERRTLTRRETDTEMAARHAAERAEYDAQGDGV